MEGVLEEKALSSMKDRLTKSGRYYRMEMKLEKRKVMRISAEPSPLVTTIDQKHLENVEYLNYLGRMITNDERCKREIKSMIVILKAAFNRKKTLCTSKLDLEKF